MSEPPDPDTPRHRLDPDLAATRAGAPPPATGRAGANPPPRSPIIDTRPYRWMIGILGLVLVVAFSVYLFTSRGVQTAGVAPGKRLHFFVAPLALTGPNLDANTNPRCDPAHPNRSGLNVCGRTPLVLGLFATGSSDCRRQIDVIQAVSRQFPASAVQFAAVAVDAGRAETAALARSHHWTIPVGFDQDGRVRQVYDVSVCPMVELAYRGGVVAQRLIGDHWLTSAAMAARVRVLLGGHG